MIETQQPQTPADLDAAPPLIHYYQRSWPSVALCGHVRQPPFDIGEADPTAQSCAVCSDLAPR